MSEAKAPPPFLLLHGFGGLGIVWEPIAARLRALAPVLAPDLPGHGAAAAWDGRAPAKSFADAALAELDSGRVAAAHWVGHSLGGAAAILAAFAAPERVASLTLLSPGGIGPAIASARLRAWGSARTAPQIQAAFAGMAAANAVLPDAVLAGLAQDRQAPGRTETLLRMADALGAGDRQGVFGAERLAGLPMPVFVLWGEADPLLPFAQTEALPPAWGVLPLPGRGHMLVEEAPDETAKLLTQRPA